MLLISFIGIILFFIALYMNKHTYEHRDYDYGTQEYCYSIEDREPTPLWLVALSFIISIIPIINLIVFFIFFILYISALVDEEIYFKPTKFMKKVAKILTKEV